jgi:hypothetical protein
MAVAAGCPPAPYARAVLLEAIREAHPGATQVKINALVAAVLREQEANTSAGLDMDLLRAVSECSRRDALHGSVSSDIRQAVGAEHEHRLVEALRTRGIPCLTEDTLRARGFAKTPDVKLEVPVMVAGRHVVCWIDSKASFGDERYHSDNRVQYAGYVNRFGPGMIVYWFGMVDTLNTDKDIFCVTRLPEEMVLLS